MKPRAFYSIGLLLLPGIFIFQSESFAPVNKSGTANLSADCAPMKGLDRVICLANAFKATLTPDQTAILQLPYTKTDAVKWSNFPQGGARPKRVGISFGALDEIQLKAAKTLMSSVLADGIANEGYDEMEGGLAADDYFGVTTGKTDMFGSKNFYLAFLGTPGATGLWELQYGGHHYAFANTYKDGKIIGVTPSFRGVEPMSVIKANGKTYQPVEQEREAFATILGSLNNSEQTSAKLSSTFSDVLLGPGKDGQFPATKQGIRVGDLNAAGQKLVLNAIKLYVNDLDKTTAAAVLSGYTAELGNTYLAYSGSKTMNQPNDYVRVDGPGIWIEYSGQPSRDFPGTVHPHAVWRDHRNDYGSN